MTVVSQSLAEQESTRQWSEVKETKIPLNICAGTFCTWREGTVRRNPCGERRKYWQGFTWSVASLSRFFRLRILCNRICEIQREKESRKHIFLWPKKLKTTYWMKIYLYLRLSFFQCVCWVSSAALQPKMWFYETQILRFIILYKCIIGMYIRDKCHTSTLFHLKFIDFLLCRFPGKTLTEATMKSRRKVQGRNILRKDTKGQIENQTPPPPKKKKKRKRGWNIKKRKFRPSQTKTTFLWKAKHMCNFIFWETVIFKNKLHNIFLHKNVSCYCTILPEGYIILLILFLLCENLFLNIFLSCLTNECKKSAKCEVYYLMHLLPACENCVSTIYWVLLRLWPSILSLKERWKCL